MPKMKTHSGAKKRFKRTATGKFKFKRAGKRHLLTPMSAKQGRSLRKAAVLNDVESEALRRFLPYS